MWMAGNHESRMSLLSWVLSIHACLTQPVHPGGCPSAGSVCVNTGPPPGCCSFSFLSLWFGFMKGAWGCACGFDWKEDPFPLEFWREAFWGLLGPLSTASPTSWLGSPCGRSVARGLLSLLGSAWARVCSLWLLEWVVGPPVCLPAPAVCGAIMLGGLAPRRPTGVAEGTA